MELTAVRQISNGAKETFYSLLKTRNRCNYLKIMKLTAFFLFVAALHVSAAGFSQKVSVSETKLSYEKFFNIVRKQTGYTVFYNKSIVDPKFEISVDFKDKPLAEALSEVLPLAGLTYSIEGRMITLLNAPTKEVVVLINDLVGKVVDENGAPIVGATVKIVEKNIGMATNQSGSFQFDKLTEGRYTLEVSSVGYKTATRKINHTTDEKAINITLELLPALMEETVVVGYGSVRREDVTGSVSSIKGEELNKISTPNFDVALVGRAPGVHVVKNSGAPGAIAAIRIRGAASALGTNEPLYVIDGIPVEMGNGLGNAQYSSNAYNLISPLASITPEDIESIDILKDASSAAIYGSRAANGVVMITTRKGKKGDKPNLTFGYSNNSDKFVKQYEMLDATQYHDVVTRAYNAAGTALPANFEPFPGANTNWVDQTTRTAVSNNYYLNLTGASNDGGTLYSFSGNVTDQDGVIASGHFKRYNTRAKIETKVSDFIKIGTNLNYSQLENDGTSSGFFYNILRYRPDVPVYDANGNFAALPDSSSSNPYAKSFYISKRKSQNLLSSFFTEINLAKGLVFRSSISFNISNADNVSYTPSTDVFEKRNGRRGTRVDFSSKTNVRIFDNTLTYINRFDDHSVNLMAGASFTETKSESSSINSINFQDDKVLNNLGSAGSIQTYSSDGYISGLASYFFRANYNYKNKYYATFTSRLDESTKFGPNFRNGFFPSGALSWKISSEDFMQSLTFISDLRLRASFGKTGIANFADFQYATFFASGSFYNNNNGVIANAIPNPNIRWETVEQLDLALEYGFLNNRLRGSIGFFNKKTIDMIINRNIIMETGGSNQYANIGTFQNRGVEFQISYDFLSSKNFSWTSDLNITQYSSKVLSLNGGSYSTLREGEAMNYFRGYKVSGIFQTQDEIDHLNAASPSGRYQAANTRPGDFKFEDVNGDGFIGTADIVRLGNAEPKFYGGWNNNLRYKNFELSALFNFSVGNYLYNSGLRDLIFFTSNANNYSTRILDAWSADNQNAKLPRIVNADPNNNRRDSDFFIQDASFFKLKNLQIAYTLDTRKLNIPYVNRMRVFASATNVFVLTGYDGLDPETNNNGTNNFSQGYDTNLFPQTKTFTVGVHLNF